MTVKNRYGLKADIGYDVTDKFAPYLTGGYSMIDYRATNGFGPNPRTFTVKNGTVGDFYYGAGFKLNFSENVSLNAEYNSQKFAAKTSVYDQPTLRTDYRTRMHIMKIGVAYNF